MGRLGRSSPSATVNYRKLVDERSNSCDSLGVMMPDFFSYACHHCGHQQKLQTEELNSILGNAFKMAYAAQLQKQSSFQDVIATQLDQPQTDKVLWTKELSAALKQDHPPRPSAPAAAAHMQREEGPGAGLRAAPPTSIPGLDPATTAAAAQNRFAADKGGSPHPSTPVSSDEGNSPTEMNSYKRMAEKPPLIKRIAMGLTGGGGGMGGGGVRSDDDSCPLVGDVNSASTPDSPITHRLSGGYVNETERRPADPASRRPVQPRAAGSPPAPPERSDSLSEREALELRAAPWYQAGIPREIALEVLGREPVGAFMVRRSTSKPGCFALSLRVPRTFQPAGIAHYLIVRADRGYKIKGFTKEFMSLTSLITHHSVMPELLPCPLSLSRYLPNFSKSDSKKDFADIDLDPDYNCFTDFRKMMADI